MTVHVDDLKKTDYVSVTIKVFNSPLSSIWDNKSSLAQLDPAVLWWALISSCVRVLISSYEYRVYPNPTCGSIYLVFWSA